MNLKSGFSKLELVVVIIVVGILGYLAYFSFFSTQQRNADDTRIQGVHRVNQSLLAYLYQENKMPENLEEGKLVCDDNPKFLSGLLANDLLKTIPSDTSKNPEKLCYYDYGPNNKYGAVVGIKTTSDSIKNVCFVEDSAEGTPSWCGEGYYCLCQPYRVEFR